jgi:hypothetical protein
MFNFIEAYRKHFSYALSLPERTVRSLAAVVGGVSVLLTNTLFPESLRETTTYNVFVGNLENFIVEKIAQVQRDRPTLSDMPVTDDYIQRKVVGSAFEAAGLLTLRFSPVWVFAIAGDVVGGSKIFLDRLVAELKRNNIIAEEVHINNLTDLLEAMQNASSKSVTLIDAPPLSRAELSQLSYEIIGSYQQVFAGTTNLLPRMENIWGRMRYFSARQHLSLERLAGVMTLDVANLVGKSVDAAFTVGEVGGGLFGEKILESYVVILNKIASDGLEAYLDERLAPFMTAAFGHFHPGKKSWTEALLRSDGPKTAGQIEQI